MADKKEKLLSYRRATWFDDSGGVQELENFIRQMDKKLKTTAAKTVVRDSDQEVICADIAETQGGGLLVHMTASTPGEEASLVPTVHAGSTTFEVTTAPAPTNSEFMDGDACLYVNGNDVCICSTNLRDGGIRSVLIELFTKAALSNNTKQFSLLKVADMPKINMINGEGIKEIKLRATLYQAAFNYSRRKLQTQGILSSAARAAKLIFGNENDITNDSLNIETVIKIDGRSKAQLSIGQKELNRLAVDLVEHQEDDDKFIIVTNSGNKITQDQMYVNETFSIDSKGKSVDRDSAYLELKKFYGKLKSGGLLEQ
jgi:hypothetical protein